MAILRDDLLAQCSKRVPTMLSYPEYVKHNSLANTPPVFAIYIVMLVTRWLLDEVGGLAAMHERNARKAKWLYDVIDGSGGFYRGHAQPASRSLMNVCFRLPSDEIETAFLAGAEGAQSALPERASLGRRHSRQHLQRDAGGRSRSAGRLHAGISQAALVRTTDSPSPFGRGLG